MKTTHVKIARRDIALAFTLDALADIQDTIADFDLGELAQYVRSPRHIADLIYSLAKQGEYLEGRKLTVDRAWIGSHLSPSPANMARVQVAVMNCLADGLKMETEEEEEGEVDVTLEEIKKKEVKEN